MTDTVYNKLWKNYYNDYLKVFNEEREDSDCEYKNVEEMINYDLIDKGFDEEEVTAILNDSVNEPEVAYRFVAYALSLYSDYYDEYSLTELLKEEGLYEDTTDDDITNILIAINEIK